MILGEYVSLEDLCSVLRSKNAGPYLISLDLIFKDRSTYEIIRREGLITRDLVAERYGIPIEDVVVIEHIDVLNAVKVTYKRRRPAGSPGDTDCFGMNQEGPLLYVKFPKETFESHI